MRPGGSRGDLYEILEIDVSKREKLARPGNRSAENQHCSNRSDERQQQGTEGIKFRGIERVAVWKGLNETPPAGAKSTGHDLGETKISDLDADDWTDRIPRKWRAHEARCISS
jgi:hypothetical protein